MDNYVDMRGGGHALSCEGPLIFLFIGILPVVDIKYNDEDRIIFYLIEYSIPSNSISIKTFKFTFEFFNI